MVNLLVFIFDLMIFVVMPPHTQADQELGLKSFQRSYSAIQTFRPPRDTWEKSVTPKR